MTTALWDVAADLTALRDLIADAAGEDVEVFDGPSEAGGRAYAPRSVTVAAAFEDDQDAVSFERTMSGYAQRRTETAVIACSVYAGSGDAPVEDLRAQAQETLAAIDRTLLENGTLGGRVARAGIDAVRWVQGADEAGVGVYIGFTVVLTRLP